ncbi:MAG: SUMF1/EgtB/PvdO family nonheme iron enzyme [Pseudomonadota bacterium]
MSRENFYILLELSPAENDTSHISTAIKKKQVEWSKRRNHPTKGRIAQQYLSFVPEIKKVMGDLALRQAEAMAAKVLLDKAEKEQFETLDEYIKILSSKGKVFEKELHTLATKFPKIPKAEIRRRIKVSIVKDQAQKTPLPLDKTTAKVISDALKIVGKSSLYDFMAVSPSSSLSALQAQTQKKDLEIKQVAHKDALITASSLLIGHCQNIFKTSKMRVAYDVTLAQERFAELNKAIDVVGSTGKIHLQEYQYLVKKALGVGLGQNEARQYILEYCHKNNYLVELPPEKPARQAKNDAPRLVQRWVWGGVGLLSLVFLAVWLVSPSKVSQALTQEQIAAKAELEKQKVALKLQQLIAEAKTQEQIAAKAELEKQKAALKLQQEKLKQQQAELEKQRAQLSVSSPPPDAEKLSGLLTVGKVFRDRLKDGKLGPEMVWIPAGSFRMGDIQGGGLSDEKPVHSVAATQRFAMGRYEVTFAEYDKFAEATGREKPDDKGWGRGNRPVINVSWHDAVAYTEWLSQQTGKKYRLPTEAEWEYAARAGTETKYWWGNTASHEYANYDSRWEYTAPVGSFAPNSFGIYDTAGNVWEWVYDIYSSDYYSSSPPSDPSGPSTGSSRVNRGGGWNSTASYCRAAYRYLNSPGSRYGNLGFRLLLKSP